MSRQPFSPLPSDPIDPKDAMRVLDEPAKVTVTTTITGHLAYELARQAHRLQCNPQLLVKDAVREYLKDIGAIVVD